VNLHLTVDTVPQLLAALKSLAAREVLVGFPSDGKAREDDGDGGFQPTNAEIAYIQDKGSPARKIPARPFMEPGIEDVHDKIVDMGMQTGRKALDGDKATVEKGLVAMGLIGENGIKNRISTGNFQRLSESTLARRRRRGRSGTKPLQDTSQMLNAVTSVVRDVK
jgi:hypothetical protein